MELQESVSRGTRDRVAARQSARPEQCDELPGAHALAPHKPHGRQHILFRLQHEDAAKALGKNVVVFKLQSFVLGGTIGALAGAFIALDSGAVTPSRWIAPLTFALYTVVILGGAGTVWGPVAGAVVYWFVLDAVDGVLNNLWFDVSDTTSGAVRLALMGIGLMALMVFRPQGILGNKKEMLAGAR